MSAALVLVPLAPVALRAAEDARWPARSRLRDWSRCRGTWNLIETGNPVYPLVFGGKYVEASDSSRLQEGLGAASTSYPVLRLPIPLELILRPEAYAKGRYIGMGIFLAAPFALFWPGVRLHRVLFAGSIVFIAVCLGICPIAVALPAAGARRTGRARRGRARDTRQRTPLDTDPASRPRLPLPCSGSCRPRRSRGSCSLSRSGSRVDRRSSSA